MMATTTKTGAKTGGIHAPVQPSAELGAIVRADLEQGQKLANAIGLKPE